MPITFWNTAPLTRAVNSWQAAGLNAAATHLRTAIQGLIAIQGVPSSRRSLPGEPPRIEDRDLIRSWTYFVASPPAYAVVYSDLDYSYYLEVGANGTFGRIEARPYVSRALIDESPTLALLLTQPIP